MESKTNAYSHHLTGAFAAVACLLFLAGCPKKLTEKVEVIKEVTRNVEVPSGPAISVTDMVTIAIVKAEDGHKAILAGCSYATAVAVGDKVGKEKADVTGIAANGVTVRLPDTSSILIKKTDTLPCKTDEGGGADEGGTTDGGNTGPAEVALSEEEMKTMKEHAKWRISVAGFLTAGYGVPVDVLLVLSVATMPHQPPNVGEALQKLQWTPAPGIEKTRFTKVRVDNGKITVAGIASGKAVFETLLKRLQTSNPLLSRVRVISSGPKPGGFGFELGIEAPLVAAAQVAVEGNPSGEKPLASEIKARLDKAAARLPTTAVMEKQDADLRALADQSGLSVTKLAPLGEPIEEGYLGMVSYEVEATGPAQALITWLAKLRARGQSDSPVIVDPLIIENGTIKAVVRVPFVVGKADGRVPMPGAIFLPNLSSERWAAARSIPVPTLRDPFNK